MAEKELDLDALSEQVSAEVEAEEGGAAATEEAAEEAEAEVEAEEETPAAEDDEDDKFANEGAKNKLQTVPWKRFDKVYKSQKELKKWRAENEKKIQYAEAYEKEVKVLSERFGEYPWFQSLVSKMLSDPKSIDWKNMHGEVGKLIKDVKKEVAKAAEGEPNELAQKIQKVEHELEVRDYHSKFKDGLQEVRDARKSLTKQFPAVDIDKDFLARLSEELPREVARLAQAGQNPLRDLNIKQLAIKLAKQDQAIANRILARQSQTGRQNQGGALIAGKGKPAGTVSKPAPNMLKDPDGYNAWLLAQADGVDAEIAGNQG